MPTWMNKLQPGAGDLPAIAEDSPAARAIDVLATTLHALQERANTFFPAGYAERVLEYLLTDDPLSVLGEQRALDWMATCAPVANPSLHALFADLPPAVALRWGRLLATAWGAQLSGSRITSPNGTAWPEALMLHACDESPHSHRHDLMPGSAPFLASQLEAMLGLEGVDPGWLLVTSFAAKLASCDWGNRCLRLLQRAPDYPDALDRHLDRVRPVILAGEIAQRLHAVALLETAYPSTLARLGDELAELATGASKQVRQAVQPLLRRGADGLARTMMPALRRLATAGTADQRQLALRLLMASARTTADTEAEAFARAAAAADKAPGARALVAEWDREPTAGAAGAPDYDVPHIDLSAAANPVDDTTIEALWATIAGAIERSNQKYRDLHANAAATGHSVFLREFPAFGPDDREALKQYLAGDDPRVPARLDWRWRSVQVVDPCLREIMPTLPLATALKLLAFFDLLVDRNELQQHATFAFNAMHAKSGRPTLLDLGLALEKMGQSPGIVLRAYCWSYGRPLAATWDAAAVWPYVAHYLGIVEDAMLEPSRGDWSIDRASLFRAAATLPRPPASLVDTLFSLALGSAKADRQLAQDALAAHAGKEARIAAALADGKADVRTLAAQWLGRLKHAGALGALEAAIAKEKNDVAKGALLDALQALGQPLEKYIDRAVLAKDAPKALAKGIPADIAWFPWHALPEVRWADDGLPVPPDVLRWLLVQAVKQKSPEPNAVLRKLCALFEPTAREAFGQFVLEAWLREDVRPGDPDKLRAVALAQAQRMHGVMASYPQQFANSPSLGKSVEELAALSLPGLLREPVGSAIGSKGLLAVAAACARERAAGPVQRYLKEWYGTRAAQGKALIALLAWIQHPSATQLMLAVGNRFRTRSFQEEAARQAEALAERKGWTLAELADRTVPSAGLDEGGSLALSYGARTFTARLQPDFRLELFGAEGKRIAALPEPRQDDDEAAAKEAKKAFAAAKKALKSIVELQTDRLYEALCTQRDWPAADWQAYLQGHPVMRHLVQRLVWCERDAEGRVLRSFRPLDDGTLTDRDDEPVTLAEAARVGVVHGSMLPDEEGAAWQRHLADYAIAPLFVQFGKQRFTLAPERADDDTLKDFEGHLLEAFALRGRAVKLGWTRGAAEDGGWFHVYEKRFTSLGLAATIEFTGNPLPEKNRTVALLALGFARSGASGAEARLPLGKVPPVLLAECRDDLRLIAADGPGFDVDWETKSEYR